MLEINQTLWFQIANFLILLFLLNIIIYRPIRKILDKRKNETNSLQGLIEDFLNRFTESKKDLNENIIRARKEGFQVKEGLKGEGLEEERAMLQDASSTVEEKIGKARDEIEVKLAGVRESLQAEVDSFSQELAEKILGRSI